MGVSLRQPLVKGTGVASLAYGVGVTPGSLLVAVFSTATPDHVPTDTVGNFWQLAVSHGTNVFCGIYWAKNMGAGPNTLAFGAQAGDIYAWEVTSGHAPQVGGVRVLGAKNSANGTGTSESPGAIASAYVDCFLVAAAANSAALTYSAGSTNWTFTTVSTASAVQTQAPGLLTSQNGTFTAGSGNWDAAAAVFGFVNAQSAPLRARAKPFLL